MPTICLAVVAALTLCPALTSFGGPGPRGGHYLDPLYPAQAYNQVQSDYWQAWAAMRSSTKKLLQTVGATNADAAVLLHQIQTNADFLDQKWNAWFETHARQRDYTGRDDYLSTLRADNWQLSRLKQEKDAAKILSALQDVASDMQIKADNCRNSGDGLGKEIKVKVHTKVGGQEVGGYEVFYVTKGMYDEKNAYDRFPRQSSPTDERILSPGRYAMWAKKDNLATKPIFLGVGGHGETHLDVDLEVSPP